MATGRKRSIQANEWKKALGMGYWSVIGHRGLYLRVAESGQRTWVYRSSAGGKSSWLRLEDVQDPSTGRGWDFAKAQMRAAELRIEAANRRRSGAEVVNPIHAARAAAQVKREAEARAKALSIARQRQREQEEALRPTLDTIAERYLGHFVAHTRQGTKRTADADLATYNRELRQRIGAMKVADLKAKHISALRDEIASASGKRHALRLLSSLLTHAKSDGLIDVNPALGIKVPLPGKRARVLIDEESRAIWAAKEVEGIRPGMLAAIKVQLATGQRAGEVLAMRWADLHEQDGSRWWTVPASVAKNGREHVVPLAPQVWALIDAQARGGELVFPPHRAKGLVSTSAYAQVVDRMRVALGLEHFTSHDLRRTCATQMAKAGTLPHVVEAVLNHISGAKAGVAGIYNLHAYLAESRTALRKWAKRLDDLAEGKAGLSAKVVALPARATA